MNVLFLCCCSDVHIIELHSASTIQDSPAVDTVMLSIRTKKRVRHKNIILILKSHNAVEWRVDTKHIRGSLEIIVSWRPIDYQSSVCTHLHNKHLPP